MNILWGIKRDFLIDIFAELNNELYSRWSSSDILIELAAMQDEMNEGNFNFLDKEIRIYPTGAESDTKKQQFREQDGQKPLKIVQIKNFFEREFLNRFKKV